MKTPWNKRTKEEVKELVEKTGYIYIDDYYINQKHRKVIVQDKKGYKYDVHLSNVLNGRGVTVVDKRNKFSLENISLWLKLNNSQFELSENSTYLNAREKLNLYCKKCKDYPTMSWMNISMKKGCGVCCGKQVGIYHNLEFQRPDIAAEWHPSLNKNLIPKNFTCGSHDNIYWICQKGHSYLSSIKNRTKGRGCGVCSREQQESKIATELKNYILNKYNAKEEYPIFTNLETNRPLPYDIYIYGGENPEVNGIYIEVHSLQHYKLDVWHKQQANKKGTTPEEEFEYQKHKDRLKRRFARKHGTYIEIDLRKIKTTEQAIEYVESILKTL